MTEKAQNNDEIIEKAKDFFREVIAKNHTQISSAS